MKMINGNGQNQIKISLFGGQETFCHDGNGYNTLGNTVTFSGTKVFLSVTELLKALLVV